MTRKSSSSDELEKKQRSECETNGEHDFMAYTLCWRCGQEYHEWIDGVSKNNRSTTAAKAAGAAARGSSAIMK